VPIVISTILQQLEDRHLLEPGLFRIPGASSEVQRICEAFDRGTIPNLTGTDPHALTGVLKAFLRLLPHPLVPPEITQQLTRLLTYEKNEDLRSAGVRDIFFYKLAPHTKALLEALANFLHLLTENHVQNGMTVDNVIVCLGPLLETAPAILFYPLRDHDLFFPDSDSSASASSELDLPRPAPSARLFAPAPSLKFPLPPKAPPPVPGAPDRVKIDFLNWKPRVIASPPVLPSFTALHSSDPQSREAEKRRRATEVPSPVVRTVAPRRRAASLPAENSWDITPVASQWAAPEPPTSEEEKGGSFILPLRPPPSAESEANDVQFLDEFAPTRRTKRTHATTAQQPRVRPPPPPAPLPPEKEQGEANLPDVPRDVVVLSAKETPEAGTLQGLIDLLVSPHGSNPNRPRYDRDFFLSYSGDLRPIQLWNKLAEYRKLANLLRTDEQRESFMEHQVNIAGLTDRFICLRPGLTWAGTILLRLAASLWPSRPLCLRSAAQGTSMRGRQPPTWSPSSITSGV
jgi:hypothetical protein